MVARCRALQLDLRCAPRGGRSLLSQRAKDVAVTVFRDGGFERHAAATISVLAVLHNPEGCFASHYCWPSRLIVRNRSVHPLRLISGVDAASSACCCQLYHPRLSKACNKGL
jgi:hypothetical protein